MNENNFVMKEKIFVMVKIILSWQVWATVRFASARQSYPCYPECIVSTPKLANI